MRIVIDGRTWGYGTGRYQTMLVEHLEQIDHEHDYSILLAPKDFETWEPSNPRFKKVLCPYKEFTLSEQTRMCKQITNMHADLVHFPMVQQPVLYRGKTVTTIQDLTTARFRNPTKNWLMFVIKQQIYKLVNIYVAKKTKQLISISEFVKHDIAHFAHISEKKITVVYEAATALPRPAEPLPYLVGKKFIMYVGRPMPHKNLGRLIEAFQLLRQNHPDLYLVLAGKKDATYLLVEGRVRQEHAEGIIFTDFVSDASLRWLYEHCEAYVFPSLSEGFGLPALEAMAHGAPVVSTNATCSPEIYGDGAYYFDPLNIHDIAAKIAGILNDRQLRQRLIKNGKKQAAKYSWDRTAEQTLAVYKKALGE